MDVDPRALDATTDAALRMVERRWRVLVVAWLSHQREPATLYEIAEAVGSDPDALRRHMRTLERLDLVSVNHDPGQRAGRSLKWSVNAARLHELGQALQALFNDEV